MEINNQLERTTFNAIIKELARIGFKKKDIMWAYDLKEGEYDAIIEGDKYGL